MIQFHLSSKANDSDEYYVDDDDEDGGHDPHPHSPPVSCSRAPNELTFREPQRTLAWNDNGRYSFRKNITSQARFSTKYSNENAVPQAQSNIIIIRAKVPPTTTLGIAHQRHCAQHHRHHSIHESDEDAVFARWFSV